MMKLLLCCLLLVYSAGRPVAHWDMVPYQIFDGPFNVGLVAFHISGLHVTMQVNGGKATQIANPTYNPQSNVWEFWTTVDPANYADGLLNVTATCYPTDGVSPTYEAPVLYHYTNSKGSLTVNSVIWADADNGVDTNNGNTSAKPVQSLAQAVKLVAIGGTVYLKSGYYSLNNLGGGGNRQYWTQIAAAPGVERDDVILLAGRPSTAFLHFVNVTLCVNKTTADGGYQVILYGESDHVWIDGCKGTNLVTFSYADVDYVGAYGETAYITGGVTQALTDGPTGAYYIKDHLVDSIYSDSWSGGNKMIVNSDTQYCNPYGSGSHPDFQQTIGLPMTYDLILYNVRGFYLMAQGFFGLNLTDAAFVNIHFP